MKSGAFFDLDNTLVRGSSLFHFGRHLVTRGMLPRRELLRFARAEAQLAVRRTEPEGGPAAIAERVLMLARGRSADDVRSLADEFAERHLPGRLVLPVLAELRTFQEVGLPTVLVTASPTDLAEALAQRLRMTAAIGTVAEIVEGRYSGRLVGGINHGAAKIVTASAAADSMDIDLSRSWAYSDSINDLPLLAAVGIAVVVNPNRHLAAVAAKNGWRVIDGSRSRRPLATAH
jgi:HAD superfamily hydrolase (TIGR01490 family)